MHLVRPFLRLVGGDEREHQREQGRRADESQEGRKQMDAMATREARTQRY